MRRLHYFLFFLLLACACTGPNDLQRTDFVYREEGRLQTILLPVPQGYNDHRMLLDTNGGKEQYYYYANGALFYFTNKVTWNTENDSVMRAQVGSRYHPERVSYTHKGVDGKGLHWKEVRINDFRYGYSYVPKALVGQFDDALNTIRIR
jgi:hypothetical protein